MGRSYDLTLEFSTSDFQTSTSNATIDLNTIEYFMPTTNILANEGYTNFNYDAI
jgi:hypothetical protein